NVGLRAEHPLRLQPSKIQESASRAAHHDAESTLSAGQHATTDAANPEFSTGTGGGGDRFSVTADLKQTLRYGENSHQSAALYVQPDGRGIAQATQLHGKEMSYNNYV